MLAAMELLAALWQDYAERTPQARAIHAALAEAGEQVVNDHIALRGFAGTRLGIEELAAPFVREGWRFAGSYRFAEKRLDARHLAHPQAGRPKIFISELRVGECSPELRARVGRMVAELGPALVIGRAWQVSFAEVEALRRESEYAAWVAAHGLRANHFTVLVNALRGFAGLAELNAWLVGRGFVLSAAGGVIKGSPGQGLEQSSTLADSVAVEFSEGRRVVPGCYYEFARRHPLGGALFDGFIEGSADRIFESTDRR
jgi:hypothetical protein